MKFEDRVKSSLGTLALDDIEVQLERDDDVLYAIVVSPSFDEMPEYGRQELVWGKMLDELTERELRRLDFIFTYTPREYHEMMGASAA